MTKDGSRYALLDPAAPAGLRLPGIDGEGWWASRNWRKKLAAWNADGTLKWAAGRRAPGRAQPGQMYNPMHLSGIARDCLFVSDAMSMTWVWHKDGFYVGRLFHDAGDSTMDENGIYVEMMGNGIHEADGKLAPGALWRQESVLGSVFEGRYQWRDGPGDGKVLPTITGQAFVCARTTLLLNPDDPFCWGVAA